MGQDRVRRTILKISVLLVFAVLTVGVIAGGVFFWRLHQGPVSMSFLDRRIETAVNNQLKGMKVTLGDAIVELDAKSGVPHVRFRNLVLQDEKGAVIASSPRAGVALDAMALLSGRIVTRGLELIGPKISARRNLDGTVALGVSGQASGTEDPVNIGEKSDLSTPRKGNQADGVTASPTANGAKLIALLDSRDGTETLSTLQDIRITDASFTLYDEANASNWYAPKADLTFRKMPYGFVVLAKADVESSGKPWHAELSATYNHDNHAFNVSTTIDNLVLADVADKIFALSQFAKLKIPLSGHIDFDAGENGVVSKANAELLASNGVLNFPDYLAQPIVIDDGALRVNYEAASGAFDIIDSSIRMGGQRADISGKITPERTADGKLDSLQIALKAKNVNLEPGSASSQPVLVDHIEFSGKAGVEKAQLSIEDLVIMSGDTGVRMRGVITGGETSPGINLAGRVRDISSTLVKKLWPPIVAAKSRKWVTEHVIDGRVAEGTFQINLAPNELAKTKQTLKMPDNSIDFTFALKDVSSNYFKNLPALVNAYGEVHQKDNNFDLAINGGETTLGSGRKITLNKGSFIARDILLDEVQGTFAFDLTAPIDAMLELANHPDINMVKINSAKFPKLQGKAHAAIGLQFPMIPDVPKERVQITTDVNISNASVKDVVPGIDLTEGQLAVEISPAAITVSGPAKVSGLPASISWKKARGEGAATSKINMTLDEKTREKLGMKLVDYMSGDVPIVASIVENDAGKADVAVDADLSKVKMKLTALGWKRDAVEGTTASLTLVTAANGSRKIQDFKLDGEGLRLRGEIDVGAKGNMTSIAMDEIRLDEDNVFSARVVPGEGSYDFTVSGKNFDARPYIKNLISPLKTAASPPPASKNQDFTLTAHFDHVTANRGEAVDDVTAVIRARGGKIAAADIKGVFLSGLPVSVKVTPLPTGRDLRVNTTDGGAAIRAANFYSKLAGGQLEFSALIGNETGSPVRNGQLLIYNFEVRNEAALAELDKRGKPTKSGPRKGGLTFNKLYMPFTIDNEFVRVGDIALRGTDMCATGSGVIRKSDGAMDITGTVIPACGISGVLNHVPLVGEIFAGGNSNEGLFGMTFAMNGSITKPNVQINPISVLAPGIFRRFFDFKSPTGKNKAVIGSKTN